MIYFVLRNFLRYAESFVYIHFLIKCLTLADLSAIKTVAVGKGINCQFIPKWGHYSFTARQATCRTSHRAR